MRYQEFCEELMRQAGQLAMSGRKELRNLRIEVKKKRVRDLVSEIDTTIEEQLRKQIKERYPTHSIIGEEFSKATGSSPYTWVIDPIDGTVSYLRGQRYFSISIALFKGKECILGQVYAPALGELYSAEKGAGSWLNGEKIEVSKIAELEPSMLATGMGCLRAGMRPGNIDYLPAILPHISDFRRCGSAALDLANTAAGRYDAFWEIGLNLYDVAAGVLLVEEAGGAVSDLYGGRDNYPYSILASNGLLAQKILAIFEDVGRPQGGWAAYTAD